MARSRNIKPGFFTNEDLVELDFATRLLFAGLWTIADKEGRLEDRPKKIKMAIFPADTVDVDAMLDALAGYGFVQRYTVNGEKYVQITNWSKHQNPHHTEKASEIPACNGAITVKEPLKPKHSQKQDGGNLAGFTDSLIPDSLIPDSLIPGQMEEVLLVDASPEKMPAAKAAPTNRGTRLLKSWVLPKPWGDWAVSKFPSWTVEFVRAESDKFHDYWTSKTGLDATKTDWEATWRNWCRNAKPPVGVMALQALSASGSQTLANAASLEARIFPTTETENAAQ